MDTSRMQLPRKEGKNSAVGAINAIKNISRASSPADVSIAPLSLTLPHEIIVRRPSIAGRKRKLEGGEVSSI